MYYSMVLRIHLNTYHYPIFDLDFLPLNLHPQSHEICYHIKYFQIYLRMIFIHLFLLSYICSALFKIHNL